MRHVTLAALMALALLLSACGTSNNASNNGSINGNWTATLLDTNNQPVFGFTTALTQTSGSGLVIANFKFTTNTACFGSNPTETGGFTLGGNFTGNVTGSFTLNIQSGTTGSSGSNNLVLQGTVNNNTVSGTWVLAGTGSGCTGSGKFTMTKG
jgi:hypothetical protein